MMFNPLVEDILKLSNQEIDAKVTDLTNKYFMTGNVHLKEQLRVMLNMHVEAAQLKRQMALEQAMSNKDQDLDKFINIS